MREYKKKRLISLGLVIFLLISMVIPTRADENLGLDIIQENSSLILEEDLMQFSQEIETEFDQEKDPNLELIDLKQIPLGLEGINNGLTNHEEAIDLIELEENYKREVENSEEDFIIDDEVKPLENEILGLETYSLEIDHGTLELSVTSLEELDAASKMFDRDIDTVVIDLDGNSLENNPTAHPNTIEARGIDIKLEPGQTLVIKNGNIDGMGLESQHEIFNISDDSRGKLVFENIKFKGHRGRILKIGEEGSRADKKQTIYMENVDFIDNISYLFGDYLIESYVDLDLISEAGQDLSFNNNETMLMRARGNLNLEGFENININNNILSGIDAYDPDGNRYTQNKIGLINLYKDFTIDRSKNLNIRANKTEKFDGKDKYGRPNEKYYRLFKYERGERADWYRDSYTTKNLKLKLDNEINVENNQAGINFIAEENLQLGGGMILFKKNLEPSIASYDSLHIKSDDLVLDDNDSIEIFGDKEAKVRVVDFLVKNNNHITIGADELVDIESENNIAFIENITSRGVIHANDQARLKAGENIDYINNLDTDIAMGFSAGFLDLRADKNINFIGNAWLNGTGMLLVHGYLSLVTGNNLNIIGNAGAQGSILQLNLYNDSEYPNLIEIKNSINIAKNSLIHNNLLVSLEVDDHHGPVNIDEKLELKIENINIIGNLMSELYTKNDYTGGVFSHKNEEVIKFINAYKFYDFDQKSYKPNIYKQALFLGNSEISNPYDYTTPIINLSNQEEEFYYPNMEFTNLRFILNGGEIVSPNFTSEELENLNIKLSNEEIIRINKLGDLDLKNFVKPGFDLREIRLNGETLVDYTGEGLARALMEEIRGLEAIRDFDNLLYMDGLSYEYENMELKPWSYYYEMLASKTGYLKNLENFSLEILNQAMVKEDSILEFIWWEDDDIEGLEPGQEIPGGETPGGEKPEVEETPGGGPGGGGGGSSDRPSRDRDRGQVIEPKIEYELNKTDHLAYLKGYKDNTIKPEGKLTRAEAAMVFYRLMEPDFRQSVETDQHDFKDIEANLWYSKPVATLANAGMLSGYKDGTFRPNHQITRAELSSMIAKLTDTVILPTEFSDIVEHWAEDYINSAQKAGWIQGYEDGSFKPDDLITRSEFTTITNSLLERKVLRENILPGIKSFKDLDEGKWYYEIMVEAINGHEYKLEEGIEIWTKLDHREFE